VGKLNNKVVEKEKTRRDVAGESRKKQKGEKKVKSCKKKNRKKKPRTTPNKSIRTGQYEVAGDAQEKKKKQERSRA